MSTAQRIVVCALKDVPKLGARVLSTSLGPIALFRNQDDQVFALDDRCPHKGGPLSQGIVHGSTVTCPLHAWKIDLSNGEALAPDAGCTRRYPVHIESGDVILELPEG